MSSSKKPTYGWRAKIGLIVPPTNTVNEAEWNKWAPEGVSIHSTRMPLHTNTESEAGKKELHDDLKIAVSYLAQADVSVIAYGCTAGSMISPRHSLPDFMEEISGIPCVTTAASIADALEALNIKSIAIATPYHEALNQDEKLFFEGQEFKVTDIKGLGYGAGGAEEYRSIHLLSEEEIIELVVSVDSPDAEAIMVSCTDLPVMPLIHTLEEKLQKPVVTSNQSTFWACLRTAGITDPFENQGKLFEITERYT